MGLTTRSDFGRNLLDFCAAQRRKRAPFFQLKGRQMATRQSEMWSFILITISTNNISAIRKMATNHLQYSPGCLR